MIQKIKKWFKGLSPKSQVVIYVIFGGFILGVLIWTFVAYQIK